MANPTAELRPFQPGPSPSDNGRIYEDVLLTGDSSVAGDFVDYTTKFVKQPDAVGGPVSSTFAGQVVSMTLMGDLDDETVVQISGFA